MLNIPGLTLDFDALQALDTPEGAVVEIARYGEVLWVAGGPAVLDVEKIKATTTAGETTYTGEQFIILDIYPKTNGTVKVTYGGLTKTITDTSGVEEPNAQQVFFGTLYGEADSVETPDSGELIIEGAFRGFATSSYNDNKNKNSTRALDCITAIKNFGNSATIPDYAFSTGIAGSPFANIPVSDRILNISRYAFCFCLDATDVVIGKGVKFIGTYAFYGVPATVRVLADTPPELELEYDNEGTEKCYVFRADESSYTTKQIIVNKGRGDIYKTAPGWSFFADIIVEES